MLDKMTVATVNMSVKAAAVEENRKKIMEYATEAGERGADLILFPEMCVSGYDCFASSDYTCEQKIALSEPSDGPTARAVAEISRKYGNYIVYGAAERCPESDILYNSAFVTGPEGIIGTYRKIHPFGEESKWCRKGTKPFLFDTPWGPVGIGICYDTYQFPELMRYYVYKGARLYLNPTAQAEEIGLPGSRENFRSYYSLLDAGVLCNTIYIASANLTGYDIKSYFAGDSCVLGPKMSPFFETEVDCYAGDRDNTEESLDMATIDLSLARRRLCQINELTGEMDYNPDLYRTFR